jgi:hypothetical protein
MPDGPELVSLPTDNPIPGQDGMNDSSSPKPFWAYKPEKPNWRPPEEGPRPKGGADFLPVGWAVRLSSVQSLAKELGISKAFTIRALKALDVPVWSPGDGPTAYFNLPSLEAALYAFLRPGQFQWPLGRKAPIEPLTGVELVSEMEHVARYYHHWTAQAMKRRLKRLARHLNEVKKVYPPGHGLPKPKPIVPPIPPTMKDPSNGNS